MKRCSAMRRAPWMAQRWRASTSRELEILVVQWPGEPAASWPLVQKDPLEKLGNAMELAPVVWPHVWPAIKAGWAFSVAGMAGLAAVGNCAEREALGRAD